MSALRRVLAAVGIRSLSRAKDGLNLYCKRCIRQKIALSRQALREYKKARVKHGGTTRHNRMRFT